MNTTKKLISSLFTKHQFIDKMYHIMFDTNFMYLVNISGSNSNIVGSVEPDLDHHFGQAKRG